MGGRGFPHIRPGRASFVDKSRISVDKCRSLWRSARYGKYIYTTLPPYMGLGTHAVQDIEWMKTGFFLWINPGYILAILSTGGPASLSETGRYMWRNRKHLIQHIADVTAYPHYPHPLLLLRFSYLT